MNRRRLQVLAGVVVGAVMVALAGVAVRALFLATPDEPGEVASVGDLADLAVEVAEGFDVEGGVDLLCSTPMPLYRMAIEARIAQWQDAAGTERPDLDYALSDVDDTTTGSFVVAITSDETGLEDEDLRFRVFVESRDARSCIVGIGGVDDAAPDRLLAGDGYQGATSPPPAPSASSSGVPRPSRTPR